MSPEPEEQKKKRRRNGDDEDGKSLQITSCDGKEDEDDGLEQENKHSEVGLQFKFNGANFEMKRFSRILRRRF